MIERLLALLFLLSGGIGWAVADVSVIQMTTTGFVTNGFWDVPADKAYHLGMFFSIGGIIGFAVMTLVLAKVKFRWRK